MAEPSGRRLRAACAGWIATLLVACRTATPVDACAEDPSRCIACVDDADCAFTGNPCTETTYCAHRDAEISVIQIGCDAALEYAWPPADRCTCDEVCTLVE